MAERALDSHKILSCGCGEIIGFVRIHNYDVSMDHIVCPECGIKQILAEQDK